jgi:hypothetical protein
VQVLNEPGDLALKQVTFSLVNFLEFFLFVIFTETSTSTLLAKRVRTLATIFISQTTKVCNWLAIELPQQTSILRIKLLAFVLL